MPTQGGHAELPPQVLTSVLAGLGAAIDAVGGSFTMHCGKHGRHRQARSQPDLTTRPHPAPRRV